jgi:hypothetical protein
MTAWLALAAPWTRGVVGNIDDCNTLSVRSIQRCSGVPDSCLVQVPHTDPAARVENAPRARISDAARPAGYDGIAAVEVDAVYFHGFSKRCFDVDDPIGGEAAILPVKLGSGPDILPQCTHHVRSARTCRYRARSGS